MQPQKAKDKTYNKIISKSNKKVDSLTQTKQRIRYRPDGKTIEQIYEYNENNKLIKKTDFNFGDKTINYIIEYDPQTGNMIKLTNYNFQDKTINYIIEYDPHFVSKKIKKTFYKPDGTVREVLNF